MSSEGEARTWRGEAPSPFRPGPLSPLLGIPGGSSPSICKPDVLHVFNLGVGSDLAYGAIVVMYRMNLWRGTTVHAGLNNAYERFHQWCVLHKHTPAIKHFDLKKFHMTSFHV